MTTIYVHIGTHKTGTTAIQKFLFTNEDILREKGFLYPCSGRPEFPPFGQHKLAWSIKTNNSQKIDSEWNNLEQEIAEKKIENIIISAEDFSTFDVKQIETLKQRLSNYKVKIIVYLRRQDRFLESLYLTTVANGRYSKNLKSFVLKRQWRCDYYKLLQSWQKSFGKNNLIVKVYEKEQYGNSLMNDFLSAVGIKEKNDFPNKKARVNQTKDVKLIKFTRWSNFVLEKFAISSKTRMMINQDLWFAPSSQLRGIIVKILNYFMNEELLSVEDRIKIMDEFSEINKKVAQEYLGRPDGKLFYSELPKKSSKN